MPNRDLHFYKTGFRTLRRALITTPVITQDMAAHELLPTTNKTVVLGQGRTCNCVVLLRKTLITTPVITQGMTYNFSKVVVLE